MTKPTKVTKVVALSQPTDWEVVKLTPLPAVETRELLERVRPVVRFQGLLGIRSGLYYVEPVNPYRQSFLFYPKRMMRAPTLRVLVDVRMVHSYLTRTIFHPKMIEVLMQIPPEHLAQVTAFEIITFPQLPMDESLLDRRALQAFEQGYHTATTRLYVDVTSEA